MVAVSGCPPFSIIDYHCPMSHYQLESPKMKKKMFVSNNATEESRCCLPLSLIILHGSRASGDCCENAAVPDTVENNSNDDDGDDRDGDFTTTLPRRGEEDHDGCWNAAALALAL